MNCRKHACQNGLYTIQNGLYTIASMTASWPLAASTLNCRRENLSASRRNSTIGPRLKRGALEEPQPAARIERSEIRGTTSPA